MRAKCRGNDARLLAAGYRLIKRSDRTRRANERPSSRERRPPFWRVAVPSALARERARSGDSMSRGAAVFRPGATRPRERRRESKRRPKEGEDEKSHRFSITGSLFYIRSSLSLGCYTLDSLSLGCYWIVPSLVYGLGDAWFPLTYFKPYHIKCFDTN